MRSLAQRLEGKYHKDGPNGCWPWTAGKSNKGYGYVRVAGRGSQTKQAYRVLYEMHVGAIPDGLALDHLCLNPACVNPAHLEPVTRGENTRRHHARQTHCPNGHEYTAENTGRSGGTRYCRTCKRRQFRLWKAKQG